MSTGLASPADRSSLARTAWNGPALARTAVILLVTAAAAAGLLTLGTDASAHAVAGAGPELTRLLRAMAGLKALMAAAAMAAVVWRLAAPASLPRVIGYAAAGAAMGAGPGLIASMDHVASGALLLHAGLLATVLMLWRDPATGERLAEAVARRKQKEKAFFFGKKKQKTFVSPG